MSSRKVGIPGSLIDCVCIVDEEDHDTFHGMSYTKKHDPVLCGEIKSPSDDVQKMPLNERKIIARRASFALSPGKVVNLGIGLPEGVANVASEEGQLPYITLTTEPGVFGGLPVSGKEFGPAVNAGALVEMNQQVSERYISASRFFTLIYTHAFLFFSLISMMAGAWTCAFWEQLKSHRLYVHITWC